MTAVCCGEHSAAHTHTHQMSNVHLSFEMSPASHCIPYFFSLHINSSVLRALFFSKCGFDAEFFIIHDVSSQ